MRRRSATGTHTHTRTHTRTHTHTPRKVAANLTSSLRFRLRHSAADGERLATQRHVVQRLARFVRHGRVCPLTEAIALHKHARNSMVHRGTKSAAERVARVRYLGNRGARVFDKVECLQRPKCGQQLLDLHTAVCIHKCMRAQRTKRVGTHATHVLRGEVVRQATNEHLVRPISDRGGHYTERRHVQERQRLLYTHTHTRTDNPRTWSQSRRWKQAEGAASLTLDGGTMLAL